MSNTFLEFEKLMIRSDKMPALEDRFCGRGWGWSRLGVKDEVVHNII